MIQASISASSGWQRLWIAGFKDEAGFVGVHVDAHRLAKDLQLLWNVMTGKACFPTGVDMVLHDVCRSVGFSLY